MEPQPRDSVAVAADLESGAATGEVDRRYLTLLVRQPDRIDRPGGDDVAERGLQTKRDIGSLVCWNFGKGLRRQRSGLLHAAGDIESPFEACNVCQIRQGIARFKATEEIGEIGAVLGEATLLQ